MNSLMITKGVFIGLSFKTGDYANFSKGEILTLLLTMTITFLWTYLMPLISLRF